MKRAVIVQGLGFGDEGKGATVDFLARELSADLVVRYCGGSQAAHNVELPGGERHAFSQFGAGTFVGARTYLSQHVIIHIGALEAEAAHLESLGVPAPWDRLTIHPQALVTTEFTQTMNRLRELARGEARHGSCGHGIGESRSYWLKYGGDAIVARDLSQPDVLWSKLELQKQRFLLELQGVQFASETARRLAAQLFDRSARDLAAEMCEQGERLQLSPTVPEYRVAIFEGAQGVLLDEWRGFHPYTTWSTVTQHHALELIAQSGADELCALGITRAYATRHGAGPFPTEDAALQLTDSGNPWNAWQQGMRFGHLDLVLLRYAAAVCGGRLDGLVVNGLDQIAGECRLCTSYDKLEALPVDDVPDLRRQEELTTLLSQARPVYQSVTALQLLETLATVAPVAILGQGPTWRDRRWETLPFRRKPSSTSGDA